MLRAEPGMLDWPYDEERWEGEGEYGQLGIEDESLSCDE